MKERNLAWAVFLLLAATWVGFLIHRSPRFGGSGVGGALGVTAAVLMLLPLLYSLVKRVDWLRRAWAPRSTKRWLLVHTYAGLLAAGFALAHTGHKFDSVLGIVLTTTMLTVVLTGFIGQYFVSYIAEELQHAQSALGELRLQYDNIRRDARVVRAAGASQPIAREALRLAEAISDLEYGVVFQSRVRALRRFWIVLHVVLSIAMYVLLALHVWASLELGLRWFS